MKRLNLILLICISFIFFDCQQNTNINIPNNAKPNDLPEETPIEIQQETKKSILKKSKNTSIDKNGNKVFEAESFYDVKGNIEKMTVIYYQSGMEAVTRLYINVYDENGNLIEVTEKENGVVICHYLYEYDDKGKIIQSFITSKNGNIQKTMNIYNDKGFVTEVKYFDINNDYKSSVYYEYDSSGNITKTISGTTINVYEYKNGKAYDLVRYYASSNNEILMEKTYTNNYQLDEDGNWIYIERTDQDGAKTIDEAEYY